ncbi:hypothetical protein Y032_0062g3304 [Ancylostoma ceylanicum]|uniref:Uncharacterized protein n=1 Tax=Ancylostoma ceylanicum TaxID=53326 RepID=A0A016U149_9BILA|nr:hypothetical protein Y032_0062g3304 [Ancylostoma ceylanicum]
MEIVRNASGTARNGTQQGEREEEKPNKCGAEALSAEFLEFEGLSMSDETRMTRIHIQISMGADFRGWCIGEALKTAPLLS